MLMHQEVLINVGLVFHDVFVFNVPTFQVMSIVQCFDIAVEGSDVSWSSTFRKLKGLLKILTLHQPADVLRYTTNGLLPSEITEEDIRRIMKQRTDFSKEAVERMKIPFPQAK